MATMQRYIAFLRAINVGGHTVKMDRLRALFEVLEFANVETFIASGNVIFDSPTKPQALEQQIERQLQSSLGYAVATFIRSAAELAAVARYQPFALAELGSKDHLLYVAFVANPPTGEARLLYVAFVANPPTGEARQKLLKLRTEIDDFEVHEREIYWLRRREIGDSTFSGALLEKTIGMPATMRNITTVKRLAAKYPAAES